MTNLSRRLRPLVALALVAAIGAGCGSNPPSESGTAAKSGTGGDKKATDRDKAVKFAECIRAHGVSDFPDPNAKNEFEYGVSVTVSGVEAGHHRLQGPAATGHVELEADPQGAVGKPQVRPVRARERREGLPGPRQR